RLVADIGDEDAMFARDQRRKLKVAAFVRGRADRGIGQKDVRVRQRLARGAVDNAAGEVAQSRPRAQGVTDYVRAGGGPHEIKPCMVENTARERLYSKVSCVAKHHLVLREQCGVDKVDLAGLHELLDRLSKRDATQHHGVLM